MSQNFDPFFVEIGCAFKFWAIHFAIFFFSNSIHPSVNVTVFFLPVLLFSMVMIENGEVEKSKL